MSATIELLSVAQAHSLVLKTAKPLDVCQASLGSALGSVLSADIASDVDSPPHDKSIVDGYAIQSADIQAGKTELSILEEVTAGRMPTQTVVAGSAIRIMTGAAIPPGADAVVMFERTQDLGNETVRIQEPECRAGQNIMRKAASLRQGDVVLKQGTRLRPIDIGLLAEVGQPEVAVYRPPQVAILATGDELVPIGQQPGPAQIRNSNGPLLAAMTTQAGATHCDLGIACDEPAALREAILRGLQADVLLLSGGVSAGVLDLVPATLLEIGVRQIFHKVKVKPGKPLWFGLYEAEGRRCLVFGLPGNPLSGFVSFELFVKSALAVLSGGDASQPAIIRATLAKDFHQRGDRHTYFPAKLSLDGPRPEVVPVPWSGSADIRGFAAADALAIFPPGERTFQQGEVIDVRPLSPAAL